MSDLRAAFLGSTYGRAGERVSLTPAGPGIVPHWCEAGQRWAIVTAWNPSGQRAAPDLNDERQAALARLVWAWSPLPGWNGEGPWREETLILRDVPLREAARLGRRFGQAAVVWGVGGRAALVWLDGPVRPERCWLRRAADSPGTADCGYTAGL
ncbi:DUF3293 domain-containing protein [Deinococcus sedimenti]|uniref:DUF3293 domain-containing protein n=1 Tax=Deinococcus sedimenti TaxID=1867090 RepID=A0ABQ2S1K8_9DEIO|nr:DUF3293 domain-containing protein [Deinococcus sedimenti]GGR81421.1 hypothetical protein GCM10008960_05450 [Deinococcus sedimenti]